MLLYTILRMRMLVFLGDTAKTTQDTDPFPSDTGTHVLVTTLHSPQLTACFEILYPK